MTMIDTPVPGTMAARGTGLPGTAGQTPGGQAFDAVVASLLGSAPAGPSPAGPSPAGLSPAPVAVAVTGAPTPTARSHPAPSAPLAVPGAGDEPGVPSAGRADVPPTGSAAAIATAALAAVTAGASGAPTGPTASAATGSGEWIRCGTVSGGHPSATPTAETPTHAPRSPRTGPDSASTTAEPAAASLAPPVTAAPGAPVEPAAASLAPPVTAAPGAAVELATATPVPAVPTSPATTTPPGPTGTTPGPSATSLGPPITTGPTGPASPGASIEGEQAATPGPPAVAAGGAPAPATAPTVTAAQATVPPAPPTTAPAPAATTSVTTATAPAAFSGHGAGTGIGALPAGHTDLTRQQVAQAVATLTRRGDGEHRMTIRLDPEALGPVEIVVRSHRSGVDVTMAAARPEVVASLLEGSSELRRLLEEQGVSPGDLDVRDLDGRAGDHDSSEDHDPRREGHEHDTTGAHARLALELPVPVRVSSDGTTDPSDHASSDSADAFTGVDLHL